MSLLFALHDTNKKSGAIPIELAQAKNLNREGYGIFWTLNKFTNGVRRQSHIEKINCWCFEIDEGTKLEQYKKIKSGPIPSLVVESKRGYHVYFYAKDAEPKYYRHFLEDRLIPFYNADENAKDFCRLLRVPNFNHMKDPANPFLVEEVFRAKVFYTQVQLASMFPDVNKEKKQKYAEEVHEVKKVCVTGDDVWQQIYELDQQQALQRISGINEVGNQKIEFKKNTNGNCNIFCNGEGTSAWIDKQKRIGSTSGGGPTVYQWLRWYGHTPRTAVDVLKKYFPELSWK